MRPETFSHPSLDEWERSRDGIADAGIGRGVRKGDATMEVIFPDSPPADPMDGDYLLFEALVDGKSVKCFITFDALTPGRNDPEEAILAFSSKQDQIHSCARSMIEAGQAIDGEIVISKLKQITPHIEFPDVAPANVFGSDALAFPAIVGGESITCIVPFEVLIGAESDDADEAFRAFQTQKAHLHERARVLIAAGQVGEDGELTITTLV
jgi:Protein of unknown function (DUF1488)